MIYSFPLQVFDAPHLNVLVGKRIRKRLDAKSIVQLLRSFDAPIGMVIFRKIIVILKLICYADLFDSECFIVSPWLLSLSLSLSLLLVHLEWLINMHLHVPVNVLKVHWFLLRCLFFRGPLRGKTKIHHLMIVMEIISSSRIPPKCKRWR